MKKACATMITVMSKLGPIVGSAASLALVPAGKLHQIGRLIVG